MYPVAKSEGQEEKLKPVLGQLDAWLHLRTVIFSFWPYEDAREEEEAPSHLRIKKF